MQLQKFNLKQITINRNQNITLVILAILVIVLICTFFLARRYNAIRVFQSQVIACQTATLASLKENNKHFNTLRGSYDDFLNAPDKLKNQGSIKNTEIPLQALPKVFDPNEIIDNFETFFKEGGGTNSEDLQRAYKIQVNIPSGLDTARAVQTKDFTKLNSIEESPEACKKATIRSENLKASEEGESGGEAEVSVEGETSSVIPYEVSITIESVSLQGLEDFLLLLDRAIQPVKVTRLDVQPQESNEEDSQSGLYQATITADMYIQTPKRVQKQIIRIDGKAQPSDNNSEEPVEGE